MGENMYLLSKLIETYLWAGANFNKRINALYLAGWIENMIDAGYECQAMRNFQDYFDVTQARSCFEKIADESGLLKKFGAAEINEEFLFKISLYEYRNGYYGSACEFLYYKKHVADKLLFPYTINSSACDEYYTNDMHGAELENFAENFLLNYGIFYEPDSAENLI